MPRWIDRMVSIAVVNTDTEDIARTKRLLAGALWLSMVTTAISVYQMVVILEAPTAGMTIACSWLGSGIALFAMWKWPASYPGEMHFIILVNIFVATTLIIIFGGQLASGVNSVWGLLGLIGGAVVFADWRATAWLIVYVVTSILGTAIATRVEPIETLEQPEYLPHRQPPGCGPLGLLGRLLLRETTDAVARAVRRPAAQRPSR